MPKGWFDADRDWGLIFGQNGGYFGEMQVLQENLILHMLCTGCKRFLSVVIRIHWIVQANECYGVILIVWSLVVIASNVFLYGKRSIIVPSLLKSVKILSGYKWVTNILRMNLVMVLILLRNTIQKLMLKRTVSSNKRRQNRSTGKKDGGIMTFVLRNMTGGAKDVERVKSVVFVLEMYND